MTEMKKAEGEFFRIRPKYQYSREPVEEVVEW